MGPAPRVNRFVRDFPAGRATGVPSSRGQMNPAVSADLRAALHRLSRREFLRASAAVLAALATPSPGLVAGHTPADSGAAPAFFLPPFLACPTQTSIRLTAGNGERAAEGVVEVRKAGAARWSRNQPVTRIAPHEMIDWSLKKLSRGTLYDYRVLLRAGPGDSWRETVTGSFRTQRPKAAAYTAALITDPHAGYFASNSKPVKTLDKVVENVVRARPEFVLNLGDVVAWPGSRELSQTDSADAFAAYAQYRRQLGPLSRQAPHFALIGNWSGESGKFPEKSIALTAAVRRALLPNPNHLTYPQGGSNAEDYFAFSWGGVLYVVLNIFTYSRPAHPDELPTPVWDVNRMEEWTLGERQMAWFESTLKRATERYRFVCMHHPAGGRAGDPINTLYGRGGARAWNIGEQASIHALMKKHRVQIFFYGHDHVFVDDVVDGIHYALPGSCGAPWKFTREETGYERSWPDSGHALLEVSPEKATVRFINLEGGTLHSFSVLPA